MHLQTLLIVFLLSLAYGQDRQLISKLNPDCPNCDSSYTLVYTKAEGRDDTIHQIWDFTRGVPSVIYAVGTVNSTMTIGWNRQEPVNFTFTGSVTYSFAAAIDKLYEYEDCQDVGHIDDKCPRRAMSLRDVEWTLNASILTSDEVMISMHGFYKDRRRSGLIHMKLDLLPFTDYAVDLPRLIHTANSSLIDISLVNFTTTMNASRYAIHFLIVSTDNWNDVMNYTMRKSLDDEHTPGVFEIIEVRTPRSRTSGAGGFMQFRPVGYTEQERTVSSSTNAYISPITRYGNVVDITVDEPLSLHRQSIDTEFMKPLPSNMTTLGRFYKDNNPVNLLAQQMYISFGLPGDGYYKQHNFTSWSFTFGYGSPPEESVSLFVIIIISIGMGVPVLLALSGITYVLVRRYRQRRNLPERFIDDE